MKNDNFFDRPIKIDGGFSNDFSASQSIAGAVITNGEDLKETEDYNLVLFHLKRLILSGMTRMGAGYCLGVSDIIYGVLTQAGIKCHTMEVQLSLLDRKEDMTYMVGFTKGNTSKYDPSKLDTHVVVVTDTEIPMIIDGSISHRLPGNSEAVIAKLEKLEDRVISKFEYKDFSFLYQQKLEAALAPALHQISILDRIQTDRSIFNNLKLLKRLNILGIVLSTFAVLNVVAKMFLDGYD